MKTNRAILVALAVAIGCLLQGWVLALCIVGYPWSYAKGYIDEKHKLALEADARVWLVEAMTLSIFAAESVRGLTRRGWLVILSTLLLLCSVVTLLSGEFYLVNSFVVGFSLIHSLPCYDEILRYCALPRGLPEFVALGGSFACLKVCGFPAKTFPGSGLYLEVSFVLSLAYFLLVVFYLPESPEWLARTGRIVEAKQVLQLLLGSEDVSDEMDLLLQNVGAVVPTSVQEDDDQKPVGEQKLAPPVGVVSDAGDEDMQMPSSSEIQNGLIMEDPFLIVSGDGSVCEESFTT